MQVNRAEVVDTRELRIEHTAEVRRRLGKVYRFLLSLEDAVEGGNRNNCSGPDKSDKTRQVRTVPLSGRRTD